MPICRLLLVLAFLASPALAADLHVLPNETVKGELVSLDDKNVVLKTDAGTVTKPLLTVLSLDLQPVPATLGANYLQVLLTDGTLLNCKPDGLAFDGKKVLLTVLPDLQVEVPLTALTYILKDAHDPKLRDHADWKTIYKSRRNQDLLVKWGQERLNGLAGTIPDGKGTSLNFILEGRDSALPIDVTNKAVQGFIFVNKLSTEAPATLCKVYDVHQNLLVASKVEAKEGGDVVVTTVSGVKLTYPRPLLARLDYSTTKRVFLSDLDPQILQETPVEENTDRFTRDKTTTGSLLKLTGQTFGKGLFLPATTKLAYKLDGEYTEFNAVVGVDDTVGGKRAARLLIEGDGKELFLGEFKKNDKRRDIKLNLKDVQELRITVESVELLGFAEGCNLNLADVKISK